MNSHIHERELLYLLFFEGKLDGRMMLLVKMLEECTYHVFLKYGKYAVYISQSKLWWGMETFQGILFESWLDLT